MKKPILSFVLAAALAVGGLTVYASVSAQKNDAKEDLAARPSYASGTLARAEGIAQRKAEQVGQRNEAAQAAEKEIEEAVAAMKAEAEAEAKKKAEAEAAAKKKAEEEAAAQKKAEEEAAAAAQKQAEEAAAAAAAAAAAQNYTADYNVQTVVDNTPVQAAPADTAVNTDVVYQSLCPYGHPLVNGSMCGYTDCPNGYCPNNSYSYGGGNVNYGSGGYQGGGYGGGYHHGSGHGGHHGCW